MGAGICGLACARALASAGVHVALFDKGRRPGGRVQTTRQGAACWDLGAQYFTARSARFSSEVEAWRAAGACAPWQGRVLADDGHALRETPEVTRYVGTPGMSAIAHQLSQGVEIHAGCRVDEVVEEHGRFRIQGARSHTGDTLAPKTAGDAKGGLETLGHFDAVVLALPAPQGALLAASAGASVLAQALGAMVFEPCFAVGLSALAPLQSPGAAAFDGVFVGRADAGQHSPLSWACREPSKPARAPGERWVLHASAAWSLAHLEDPHERVASALCEAFAGMVHCDPKLLSTEVVRRWLYARPSPSQSPGVLVDARMALIAAGDWSFGGRVEGAYLAGVGAADALATRFGVSMRRGAADANQGKGE